jgi:hypothetical protein
MAARVHYLLRRYTAFIESGSFAHGAFLVALVDGVIGSQLVLDDTTSFTDWARAFVISEVMSQDSQLEPIRSRSITVR